MKDDELLAIYGAVRHLAAGMKAREASLQRSTAELEASIAQIKQLPAALGQQSARYIAAGVKQAVQENFSWPVEEALKGPLGKLNAAADEARTALGVIKQESRFQTLGWFARMFTLRFAVGAFGTYFFFTRQVAALKRPLGHSPAALCRARTGPGARPAASVQEEACSALSGVRSSYREARGE